MIGRARPLFRNPVFLLASIAFFAALVVQSGELGSSDTSHRLQATHSFWTNEPPVFPDEYPEFGIHGRGGRLYGWYGLGQSLLMLPADVVGTYLDSLRIFAAYHGTDPTVRAIFVSFTMNILICVLACVVCFRLLGAMGFNVNQRFAGALALLFATTFLHYTQNMMENNLIALCTLTGLTFQYEWLRTGERWALALGSAALGMNLITRLTTGMDLLGVSFFLVLVIRLTRIPWATVRLRIAAYARIALPIYVFFFLIDRAYQFIRFGSFLNTYVGIVAREARQLDPTLPPAYPFETPFHVGFFGALFTREKSIFLFDPLLVLTILVVALAWKRFTPQIKAYLMALGAMLVAYICFYAKYTAWAGDTSWGDRYVSTTVQLTSILAVPLLMRYRAELGKLVWRVGLAIVGASVAIQLGSVAFWCSLERYQMETLGPQIVVWLRWKNIVAFALGKMTEWGLTNASMHEDAWDYVHITTWNFLPFLLKRVGEAPGWVVDLLAVLWFLAVAALICLLMVAARAMAQDQLEPV